MVKKIGILGCQSKHSEFFGSLFNTQKIFPGYEAVYIFGDDDPGRLPYVVNTAKIPNVCKSVDELIDKSDAVLITYRLSEKHLTPALACIKKRKPVFIDKPFQKNADEARNIVNECLKQNSVVQGGSTLCFDPQITHLSDISRSSSFGTIAFRADIDSPFGGYRFYTSHLTDLCSAVFGTNAVSVKSFCHNSNLNHLVSYPSLNVMLHSTPDFLRPQVLLSSENSISEMLLDDENCYYYGMKTFIEAMENGIINSQKLEQLIFSTKLLDAINQSLTSGEEIRIENL